MRITYLIGIFLCIVYVSCTKTKSIEVKKSSIQQKKTKPIVTEEQEEEKSHSVLMQEVLDRAISKLKLHLSEDVYKTHYEEIKDSFILAKVNISTGNFFSKKERHAIVSRSDSGTIHFNIFSVDENKLKEILHHEQSAITYISDTIQDINGDQRNDFVINGYGSSGCCLKAFSNVYLFQKDSKEFTNIFHFLNPTFSPKEGVIRGICYGHAGETEMYTYKWNGTAVDTLEFMYFQRNLKGEKTGKIIRSNKRYHSNEKKVEQVLHTVPKEYRNISGYDWFLGNI
ncbi:hypothetical protein [uncultured Kordia sp.]|uniref:hypothetical protein n=1 Tax=uncultured Kordia sp. TaxID=507699 RepID=UPI00262788F2|nr:hypothetical protein [uncultured Kordia sp.]